MSSNLLSALDPTWPLQQRGLGPIPPAPIFRPESLVNDSTVAIALQNLDARLRLIEAKETGIVQHSYFDNSGNNLWNIHHDSLNGTYTYYGDTWTFTADFTVVAGQGVSLVPRGTFPELYGLTATYNTQALIYSATITDNSDGTTTTTYTTYPAIVNFSSAGIGIIFLQPSTFSNASTWTLLFNQTILIGDLK